MDLTRFCLLVLGLIFTKNNFAQPYETGHTSIAFYDNARNRTVNTEIYYPALTEGDDVAVAPGSFPVLVFGHGFLMSWEAYENFRTALVPEGYIICFPTTESGISPDHGAFGQDLRFVAAQMQIENTDNTALFFGSIMNETALMGHSMGGGAAFLAAENNPAISTLVTFAAAETNPSAIAAAGNVDVPALVYSGQDDCVTPPGDHQLPMYNSLSSACKTYLSVLQGTHCYFANFNFSCNLGESFCNPVPDISRADQHATTFDFLKLWLDYAFYGDQDAYIVFSDSLQMSSEIAFQQLCAITNTNNPVDRDAAKIFPNPVTGILNIELPGENTEGKVVVYDLLGKEVFVISVDRNTVQIDLSGLQQGYYFLVVYSNGLEYSERLIRAGGH